MTDSDHVLIKLGDGEIDLELVLLPAGGFAIDRPNGERLLLPVKSSLKIGRKRPAPGSPGADVVVRFPTDAETGSIGRIHVEIDRRADGEVWVVDRSSTGLTVNGVRTIPGEWHFAAPGSRLGMVPIDPVHGRGDALLTLVLVGEKKKPAPNESLDDMPSVVMPVATQFSQPGLPFSHRFMQEFELVKPLGKGATGAVYLMRQLKLDRLVAVKVVLPEVFTEEETRRLLREARVLARLNHANIMTLYDFGMDRNRPYLVCEYVEGDTLRSHLLAARMPLARVLAVMTQIMGGLAVAHENGVVHRDLKPANILMTTRGVPKIADFGVARAQAIDGAASNDTYCTPMYMSPEQCRGVDAIPASDVYSAGVMVFQAASGHLPFPGPGLMDFVKQHASQTAPRLRAVDPALPEALDTIVARALAKRPEERYASARDMLQDLIALYRTMV